MSGPDYTAGCPSCSAIADGFSRSVVHLANHDITLNAVSRAPLAKIQAYKRRMGWSFALASSYGSDFGYRFRAGHTKQAWDAGAVGYNLRVSDLRPPAREESSRNARAEATVSTDWETYRREGPGMSTFALKDGVVYHAYSAYARGLDAVRAYTRGSAEPRSAATRPAPGGAATTSTTASEITANAGWREGHAMAPDHLIARAREQPVLYPFRPLASSRPAAPYRRLSEVVPVYAAPDQDVCGVDTVTAQRRNHSHLVLKAAATRRCVPGLPRRHCLDNAPTTPGNAHKTPARRLQQRHPNAGLR